MHQLKFLRRVAALALCGSALWSSAWSIVWRHDRDPNLYIQLANQPQFAGVGLIGVFTQSGFLSGLSGTVIADGSWVLTCAHGLDQFANNPSVVGFRLGNDIYTAQAIYIHPRWNGDLRNGGDFGLIRLTQRVQNVTPALLNTRSDLVGRVGYSVGYGSYGNGLTGYVGYDDTRRAMTNVIDLTLDDIILSDFDHPDGTTNAFGNLGSNANPLDLEGIVAPGDSGGPVFIEVDGVWYIAGVHSFLGDVGPPIGNGQPDARYGDILGAARVDYHIDWINATVPEPASMTALALGLVGLWARRRRRG